MNIKSLRWKQALYFLNQQVDQADKMEITKGRLVGQEVKEADRGSNMWLEAILRL